MDLDLNAAALEYHRKPTPGKIAVTPTKGLVNQRDLALAYSPGVAAASLAIAANPSEADSLTSRANLVGVISNGTAVLGLGDIGPLAAKPVMEGKACLFKKFAGIDVFDIELAEKDPDKLVDIICALEPTLGGINLEDIRAPECFYIEQKLRERLGIPVFHDDQHGTAIISAAALINGLKVVGKSIDAIRLVCSGAGAAAIACLDLMCALGLRRDHVWVLDSKGVIHVGRDERMEPNKARYAQATAARTLAEVIDGADVFLGLSTGGVLKPEMVARMAPRPLIFALANPVPEIMPDAARAVRPDCVIATGRSDFPNQVNNVLCFPFIFRGALDVGATAITDAMKLACVQALAGLAEAEQSDIVAQAYGGEDLSFGPNYIIPKPFDPRLIERIAPAVAEAAMASGVATRPVADLDVYRQQLSNFVYHSGLTMKPVFAAAKATLPERKRVIYAEGEDERVLRALRPVIDERLAVPILVGRPQVIAKRIERAGLRLKAGEDFTVVNPESDPRHRELSQEYYRDMARQGVTPEIAKSAMRANTTLIAAMLLRHGDADAMVCGVYGRFEVHLRTIEEVIGLKPGVRLLSAMNLLMLPKRTLFIADTYVHAEPNADEVAAIAAMAADEVRRFGIVPRVALLSHSNFGSADSVSARKMRTARALLRAAVPDLEVEGEMHADAALSREIRARVHPEAELTDEANLLIMPNIDAANIAFNLLKVINGEGITVGPILLGAARAVHVLTPSATVRRIVNMTALATADIGAVR
ncbi:MAG: NADP-dependent malic enzyme [Rhodocyclaceae bacterium]|nr:NADP-dependent malic enzyme [Rhodocyclaceae bacterium]